MSTMNEVMSHVIPLITSLDRRLGILEDRSTFVVILYDEQWKKDLSELRNVWRTQEARRREEGKVLVDAWQAAGSQSRAKTGPSCASLGELLAVRHVEATHGARRQEDAPRPSAEDEHDKIGETGTARVRQVHISRSAETPGMCERQAVDVGHHVPGVHDKINAV